MDIDNSKDLYASDFAGGLMGEKMKPNVLIVSEMKLMKVVGLKTR